MSGLLDARGCLTGSGLAAMAHARPGEAPPELAQHVASCVRCQERWLQSAAPPSSRARGTAGDGARRRWGMLAIVVGVLLFSLIALLATLLYVAG